MEREEVLRKMAKIICVSVFITRRRNVPTRTTNRRAEARTRHRVSYLLPKAAVQARRAKKCHPPTGNPNPRRARERVVGLYGSQFHRSAHIRQN